MNFQSIFSSLESILTILTFFEAQFLARFLFEIEIVGQQLL